MSTRPLDPQLSRDAALALSRASADLDPAKRRKIVEAVEKAGTYSKLPRRVRKFIKANLP